MLFRHDAICRFGRSDLPRPTAKRSTRMSLSRWRQELLSNYFGSNELVNSHSPLQASCRRCGCGCTLWRHALVYSTGVERVALCQAAVARALWDVSYAKGVRICDYDYGKNPGFPNNPCDR